MLKNTCWLLTLVILIGCASSPAETADGGELIRSELSRDTDPDISSEQLRAFAAAQSAFAWELYAEAAKEGNFFFSPYSLSVALGMTWAGARALTESEMASVMHLDGNQTETHTAFNALDLELATRAGAPGEDLFALKVTNGLFGRQGMSFVPGFLDTLARNYDAGMRLMDFVSRPEASRTEINRWVREQTEDRIEELLPQGSITDQVALVLVNAIYFAAPWGFKFDPAQTKDDAFRRLDESEVTVPVMRRNLQTQYAQGQGFKVADLPFGDGAIVMMLLVPDSGAFDPFEDTLTAARVSEIRAALSTRSLDLEFPKFSFSSSLPAAEPLQALGMREAFSTRADFSGIADSPPLRISDVRQEAFIKVDEEGAEAAAATAVVVVDVSVPPPAELRVDRPFIFVILDRLTGTTLFIGRVLDPLA